MKKFLLRELFWFVFASVLSLVLAFIFIEILDLTSSERSLKPIEKVFSVQIYFIGGFVSIIVISVVRVVVAAIKMFVNK